MAKKRSAKTGAAKKARVKKTASEGSTSTTKKTGREPAASARSASTNLAEQIEVEQSSEYRGNDWWDWSVWIEAPKTVLDKIEYVEYRLHPTFPERIQRRTNRDEKFLLQSDGWGEFMIEIEVKKEGGSKVKMNHWLTLEYPSPSTRSGSISTSAEKKEERRPTIFLSAGVSDLRMGNALSEALKQRGLAVLKPDDLLSSELPWEIAITGMMKAADLMVVLISGGLTSWAMREIDAAMKRDLPIVPVIIGPVTRLPEQIESFQRINLKDTAEPDKIAPHVAAQITEAIKVLPHHPK